MTYDYTCNKCFHEPWEVQKSISDNSIEVCPFCGSYDTKRLISQGNFVLRGNGWYADGYDKKNKSSLKESS
jgi:putative FmdB family regulatory protein